MEWSGHSEKLGRYVEYRERPLWSLLVMVVWVELIFLSMPLANRHWATDLNLTCQGLLGPCEQTIGYRQALAWLPAVPAIVACLLAVRLWRPPAIRVGERGLENRMAFVFTWTVRWTQVQVDYRAKLPFGPRLRVGILRGPQRYPRGWRLRFVPLRHLTAPAAEVEAQVREACEAARSRASHGHATTSSPGKSTAAASR